jgi:replicative DNA helicase
MTTSRSIPNAPPFPLHDLDAESAVMGACCSWPGAADAALDAGLRPDHFSSAALGYAFQAASSLVAAGKAVDAVTVAAELARLGLPGPSTGDLISAIANAPAVSRVGEYAGIVVDVARRRRLIGTLMDAVEIAHGPGSFSDIAQDVDRLVTGALAADRPDEGLRRIGEAVDDLIGRLLERIERGVRTGWRDLDDLIGALPPGSLALVANRPSGGKSALLQGLADHVASTGVPVLFASVEMSEDELAKRELANRAHVPTPRLRPPLDRPDLERISLTSSEIADLPLFISTRNRGAAGVASEARRLARRDGLGLVCVDYLQLLTSDQHERRELAVAESSRTLKRLAVDLDIPVVAACQLNRELEHRDDKKPRLADLRESGSLEQDADLVLMLHQDADAESPTFGTTEVIVAKNRNGPTGSVRLAWLPERMVFADLTSRGYR